MTEPSGLPDRRRPTNEELLDQMGLNQEANKAEIKDFIRKGLIAFSIIAIFTAIAIFGFGLVLTRQSQIFRDIQQQRYDVSYDTCIDQNERHDETIDTLNSIVKTASERPDLSEAEKKQQAQGAASSILLIDALVPRVSDCAAQAQSRVNGAG